MSNVFLKHSQRAAASIEDFLPPYSRNITEHIIALEGGRLLAVVDVAGIPFESETDSTLAGAFDCVNNLLSGLGKEAGGKLAVWTHLVKRRIRLEERYVFRNRFIQQMADRYCARFEQSDFFETRYTLSFVLKYADLDAGIKQLETILATARHALARFVAEPLGVDEHGGIVRCAHNGFLAYLLNHCDTDLSLSHTPIVQTLGNADWHFGYDTLEIRNRERTDSQFAVFYELRDYPADTYCGMWDFLLGAPCEFVLSQSFVYMGAMPAMRKIDQQINRLVSTDDAAEHQIEELQFGKGYLSSGELAFGDYQASLMVFGDSAQEAIDNGIRVASEFFTSGNGARFTRSNLEAFYTFLSIFPGSHYRPIPAPHSTVNLSCGFSLHNYSLGKRQGNPIGDGSAIMPVRTVSDGLYFLNTHYSPPHRDMTGQPLSGHLLLLGMTGTGKTTLQAMLCAFLQRFNPMLFAIDFNRSMELFIRAYGGTYFTLQNGVETGLNPFQLEETPSGALLSFLYRLVECCGRDHKGLLSAQEEQWIKQAVDTVMHLPLPSRRFSTLLQSIPKGCDLRLRLARWCTNESGETGKYAWALDAPANQFDPKTFDKIGFDTTELLTRNNPVTEPILATLFFLKDTMQAKGRLMQTIVEEFWVPCAYPLTLQLIKSVLKSGRLKGEFIYLVSQSPEDAIACEEFPAIVQQTPTKILLPNPDAQEDGYCQIGLTEKEFYALKALDKESRTFLIKQSGSSCFAKMDLRDFDDFLPIISGTTENIQLCAQIRAQIKSDDPDKWIPLFRDAIKQRKGTSCTTQRHTPARPIVTLSETDDGQDIMRAQQP